MTISEVGIANIALTQLGARIIISVDDDNIEANMVKVHYDAARDAVLEEREWTFAVKRATLAKLEDPPEWGYGAAFQLPPDTLRVMAVRDDAPAHVNYNELMNTLDWRREGDTIVCDANIARIRYLAQITNPLEFSPAFVQCLAARLAMEMAIGLTQSSKLQSQAAQLYELKLKKAASTDGMQGRTQVARSSRLTGVRGIGASVGGGFASGTV